MPYALADGLKLYWEQTGSGTPIVFVHEFAGDLRSWEPQVRFFSRRFCCITYNARGYPPSDVSTSFEQHSQAQAADDILVVMKAAGIERAHVVGLSMGGYAALHFGLRHAQHALSITVAGAGFGSDPDKRAQFHADTDAFAERLETLGMAEGIKDYAVGPARVQHLNKDPRGFAEFHQQFAGHDATGSANTLRGFMRRRDAIQTLETGLRKMTVPTHVITGDEDDNCLEPGIWMKRTMPGCGLTVMCNTGHAVNLEEPEYFNRLVLDFITLVDGGRWQPRDLRSFGKSTLANKA